MFSLPFGSRWGVLSNLGLFLKMGIADGEEDPLVGSSRPDHVVEIHKTASSISASALSTSSPSSSDLSAVSLQGHIAILPAAKKWWAVSRLWFTGKTPEN